VWFLALPLLIAKMFISLRESITSWH